MLDVLKLTTFCMESHKAIESMIFLKKWEKQLSTVNFALCRYRSLSEQTKRVISAYKKKKVEDMVEQSSTKKLYSLIKSYLIKICGKI